MDYALTPLGLEAAERVRALADWIEASIPRIAETRRRREGDAGGPPAPPSPARPGA